MLFLRLLAVLAHAHGSETGNCTLDFSGRCWDGTSLLQGKVNMKPGELSTDAGSLSVECRYSLIEEDKHPGVNTDDEPDGLQYGLCREAASGHAYYLLDDPATENLVSGDKLKLTLVETAAPSLPAGVIPPWEANKVPLYKVTGTSLLMTAAEIAAANRAPYFMQQEETKEVAVLIMLLNYTDKGPDYMTEKSAWEGLYGTAADFPKGQFQGSMSDMLEHSSYGKVKMPPSKGKIFTVNMGTKWADVGVCDTYGMVDNAIKKLKEQHPEVDPQKFTFREAFIPSTPDNGCGRWCGVAGMGCGHPSILPNPGGCLAVYRCSGGHFRAHELGHNLGLGHSGGPAPAPHNFLWDYGDPESNMGASSRMTGYIASAREQLGFLSADKPSEILQWASAYTHPVALGSISLPPNQPGANFVAVKWKCPACRSKIHASLIGGYIWLQFRGDTGYSALEKSGLQEELQNSVYVHLARPFTNKRVGSGSEMWAKLNMQSQSRSFTPADSNFTVRLCSIAGGVAKVAIAATAAEAQTRCALNAQAPPTTTTTTTTTTTKTTTVTTTIVTYPVGAGGVYYKGCFKNEGADRVNGHTGGMNIDECKASATSGGMYYFGMEFPQGNQMPGEAHCLEMATMPSMTKVVDSECEVEDLPNGNRLGGFSRMAVYGTLAAGATPAPTQPPDPVVYVGCYINQGADRVGGHHGNKNMKECDKIAKSGGKDYFGMEYPQGCRVLGDAYCLALNSLPSMQKAADTECEVEGLFHGNRLGGSSRLAVYSRQASLSLES